MIKREMTFPYNSQRNGVAKRKNKVICEATKAMIHDHGLLGALCEKPSTTMEYVMNKISHQILGDKTPEEECISMKP